MKTQSPLGSEVSSRPEREETIRELLIGVATALREHTKYQQEAVEDLREANRLASVARRRSAYAIALMLIATVLAGIQIVRHHYTVTRLELTEVRLLAVQKEMHQTIGLVRDLMNTATAVSLTLHQVQEEVQQSPKLRATEDGQLKLEIPFADQAAAKAARNKTAAKPAAPVVSSEPSKAVISLPPPTGVNF